jgi:DNA-binding HxlR family transcriptional regulator
MMSSCLDDHTVRPGTADVKVRNVDIEVKNPDFTCDRRRHHTDFVRTYGQYCPIARGAEIFAERWTPLIIRNLYLGCGTFGEILEGAPGLSRTMLSQRLKQLENLGVVQSAPKRGGRGHHYELTSAGRELFAVCQSLGEWGARWLEITREHLDPFVALWSLCNALRRDRRPDRRVVIRFDFTGRQRRERFWLLIERGDTEICRTSPGLDEELCITAEAEAFVKWHAGQLSWAQAIREGRIQVDGVPSLAKAFPTWNARSAFADITPMPAALTRA